MLILLEPNGGSENGNRDYRNSVRRKLPRSIVIEGRTTGGTPMERYVDPLHGYRPSDGTHIICTRWHLSQAALAHADPLGFAYIEMFLASRGAVVVSPPTTVTPIRSRDSAYKRNQLYRVPDEVSSSLEVLTSVTLANVLYRAAVAVHGVSPLAGYPGYVGPPKPQVLVISPVCRPDTSAGRRLFGALLAAEIPFGIHDPILGGVETLWRGLGRPGVVAVGTPLHRLTYESGIPSFNLNHPASAISFRGDYTDRAASAVERAESTSRDWRTR